MICGREHIALEATRGESAHEVDAAAGCIANRDRRVLLLELVFDLCESGEQTTGVADVQLVSWRLCVKRRRKRDGQRECDSPFASFVSFVSFVAQNATSIDAATVRGCPR